MVREAATAIGVVGGWLFLFSAAANLWLGRRRRRLLERAAKNAPAAANVGPVGVCPKCQRPRLPPGITPPEYLKVCACPPPSVATAMAGQPPRPVQ